MDRPLSAPPIFNRLSAQPLSPAEAQRILSKFLDGYTAPTTERASLFKLEASLAGRDVNAWKAKAKAEPSSTPQKKKVFEGEEAMEE